MIQSALGGENITRTIEGRERYPVNVRYERDFRESIPDLERVLVKAPGGAQVPLGQLAAITLTTGPAMIRDENAQLAGYVYIDTATRDIGGYVERAQRGHRVGGRRCRPATRCCGRGSTSSRCARASGCRS